MRIRMTYRVSFTDAHDGCPNQKILQAYCAQDILDYMAALGHTNVEVVQIP